MYLHWKCLPTIAGILRGGGGVRQQVFIIRFVERLVAPPLIHFKDCIQDTVHGKLPELDEQETFLPWHCAYFYDT